MIWQNYCSFWQHETVAFRFIDVSEDEWLWHLKRKWIHKQLEESLLEMSLIGCSVLSQISWKLRYLVYKQVLGDRNSDTANLKIIYQVLCSSPHISNMNFLGSIDQMLQVCHSSCLFGQQLLLSGHSSSVLQFELPWFVINFALRDWNVVALLPQVKLFGFFCYWARCVCYFEKQCHNMLFLSWTS